MDYPENMPWVIELTSKERQELRNKKQELTEYGKEQLRKLMKNQEPYPDAMFEEAARRETQEKLTEKVADCCIEEYNKKYGERPEDQYWMYMIAEYYATGEGQTTCLMVTQASPNSTDYAEGEHHKELNTKEYRAVRAFHKEFGTWHLHGLRFLSKDDFYRECVYYLPPVMMKLSNTKCFLDFHTMVHYNFG